MYAVIFNAKVKNFDDNYYKTAVAMKDLAMQQYNCIDFISTTEAGTELAISYWHNLDDIKLWKQDRHHQQAQLMGQSQWYESYHIQIVEVIREYSGS